MEALRTPDGQFTDLPSFAYEPRYVEVANSDGGALRMAYVAAGPDDGGTVLLHDSDCTSRPGSWRSTLAALPLLAAELRDRNLAVRPLGEHLGAAA